MSDANGARSANRRSVLGRSGAMVAVVLAVAIGARLSFGLPGAAVPQSLQTLAVLVGGGLLGPLLGAGSMVLYLVAGALGVPLFADGAAGIDVVLGPSLGYLVGFVMAAGWMGAAVQRVRARAGLPRLLLLLAAGLIAHGMILLAGGGRLALLVGWNAALNSGVAPFMAGAVVKSFVAALTLYWSSNQSSI